MNFLIANARNSINVCVTGKRKRESNCNKVYFFLIVFSVLPKFYVKTNKRQVTER